MVLLPSRGLKLTMSPFSAQSRALRRRAPSAVAESSARGWVPGERAYPHHEGSVPCAVLGDPLVPSLQAASRIRSLLRELPACAESSTKGGQYGLFQMNYPLPGKLIKGSP